MKANSLREAITAAIPDLATDPDRLAMWIEKGRIRSPNTDNRGFEWDYVLNITIEEFTGHPSIPFLVINDWARTNQLELVQPGQKHGYDFQADVIDAGTVDFHIQLPLTERVSVTRNADGTDSLQHLDDTAFLLADEFNGGPLASVFTGGEQTIPGPPLP